MAPSHCIRQPSPSRKAANLGPANAPRTVGPHIPGPNRKRQHPPRPSPPGTVHGGWWCWGGLKKKTSLGGLWLGCVTKVEKTYLVIDGVLNNPPGCMDAHDPGSRPLHVSGLEVVPNRVLPDHRTRGNAYRFFICFALPRPPKIYRTDYESQVSKPHRRNIDARQLAEWLIALITLTGQANVTVLIFTNSLIPYGIAAPVPALLDAPPKGSRRIRLTCSLTRPSRSR